jgi:hypothetical protein
VVLDWTSAGAGTPLPTGARLFDVAIASDVVAGLDTTEAVYDVELRATDRLSRTTTASRCFELRLKAPPLRFSGDGSGTGHTLALDSLSLAPGAAHDRLAARLLNDDATGASLIDQHVVNGTTETVYLTVTVTKPGSVTASQFFVVRNHTSITAVTIDCFIGPENEWNPACDPPAAFPPGGGYSPPAPITTTATALTFPVKLFELDGAGAPATEIPCLAPCSAGGSVFKFAVPPRAAGGAAARRFIVMTMIGQVSNLWPKDNNQNASPPFSDSSIHGVRYTGALQFFSSGCGKYSPGMAFCQERWQRTQYRALTDASLDFGEATVSSYATAAVAHLAPVEAALSLERNLDRDWATSEGALP